MSTDSRNEPTPSIIDKISSFFDLPGNTWESMDEHALEKIYTKAYDLMKENSFVSAAIDDIKHVYEGKINTISQKYFNLQLENKKLKEKESGYLVAREKLVSEKQKEFDSNDALNSEITLIKYDLEAMQRDHTTLEARERKTENVLEQSKLELQDSLTENSALKEQIGVFEGKLDSMTQELWLANTENKKLQTGMKLLRENNLYLEIKCKETDKNKKLYSSAEDASRLQDQLQIVSSEILSLKSEIATLKYMNESLSTDLQRKLFRIKDLDDNLNSSKQEFAKEITLKQRVNELLHNEIASYKKQIERLTSKNLETPEKKIIQELVDLKEKLVNSEKECNELKSTVDKYINIDEKKLISKFGNPKKLIEILRRQLVKEKRHKDTLQRQVESFLVELEQKLPMIDSFKERNSSLERELLRITSSLEETAKERDIKDRELTNLQKKISNNEQFNDELLRQRSDLAHQVQYLLLCIDNKSPFTEKEATLVKKIVSNENTENDTDSHKIISKRLLHFQNVKELQQKNMELLRTTRQLVQTLERQEQEQQKTLRITDNNKIVESAKSTSVDLEKHIKTLESKINIISQERDSYKLLVTNSTIQSNTSNNSISSLQQCELEKERLTNELSSMKQQHVKVLEELENKIKTLQKSQLTSKMEVEKHALNFDEMKDNNNLLKEYVDKLENKIKTLEQDLAENELFEKNLITGGVNNLEQSKIIELSVAEQKISFLDKEISNLKSKNKNLEDKILTMTLSKNLLDNKVLQLETSLSERELPKNTQIKNEEKEPAKQQTYTFERKKLESVNDSDISYLYYENLEELQNQFRTLRRELKEVQEDLDMKTESHLKLENKYTKVKNDLKQATYKLASVYTTLEQKNSFLANSVSQLQGKEKELNELKSKLVEKTEKLQMAENENSEKINNAIVLLQTMVEENTTFKDAFKHFKNSLSRLRQAINSIQQQSLVIESNYNTEIDHANERLEEAEVKMASFDGKVTEILESYDGKILNTAAIGHLVRSLIHEKKMLALNLNSANYSLRRARYRNKNPREKFPSFVKIDQQSKKEEDKEEVMENTTKLLALEESNAKLIKEVENCTKVNETLSSQLADMQVKLEPLEQEINELKLKVAEKEQHLNICQEELERWKLRSQTILQQGKIVEEEAHMKSLEKIKTLEEQLETVRTENAQLTDRFDRLKKQAHEKLDAAKTMQINLTTQINELNETKVNLEKSLQQEIEKNNQSGNGAADESEEIIRLRAELEKSNNFSNELEKKVEDAKKFKNEIESLKSELQSVKAYENSTVNSKIIKDLKESFKREKDELIEQMKKEFKTKLEKEKETILAQRKNNILANGQESANIEELKKKWEEEQEALILKRITEAEENLKKRMRLPSEEKINAVIEKRRKVLEQEFETKLRELGLNADGNGVVTDTRAQIEKELREKFNLELAEIKKKAFEEGKQQSMMKSTLLERKLSKLESQTLSPTKNNDSNETQVPSKINLSNINSSSPPLGEKVLQLNYGANVVAETDNDDNPFTLQSGKDETLLTKRSADNEIIQDIIKRPKEE
ncbi:Mlp2p NDAI_0F00290 [Naumovozyma dairenensis CBS 421]|uniref:NUA/TPR/MLP1-2-like domain-containing protein n=1 Tax=Naumovozyma dairenensis (strain ATCC 10597 / BCRC 20456 / CBS 421 / NBRC 0211 / NRRL Y-12639) TaxID=1071378 RepID=G0WC37_NAUDC|nr:hypothetical protein NDAI_0F00290 [Naumovozyma dairenensis CBS 421]CCD25348.1 hypothetical protein NDAI_0F00290 [Naumovozyma dairenensis CBS 421]